MIYNLNSVCTAVDAETLLTYPMLSIGGYDKNQFVHIDDVCDEWFNSLSDEDFGTIDDLINNRNEINLES
jgi:hypothetical protein